MKKRPRPETGWASWAAFVSDLSLFAFSKGNLAGPLWFDAPSRRFYIPVDSRSFNVEDKRQKGDSRLQYIFSPGIGPDDQTKGRFRRRAGRKKTYVCVCILDRTNRHNVRYNHNTMDIAQRHEKYKALPFLSTLITFPPPCCTQLALFSYTSFASCAYGVCKRHHLGSLSLVFMRHPGITAVV